MSRLADAATVELSSHDLEPARVRLGRPIAHAAMVEQHSRRSGAFGWEGEMLWVRDGLRATFVVHFCPAAQPPQPQPDAFAYKRDGKLQERLAAEMKALLAVRGNGVCADCGAERMVRFVSVTLGVFLCNRCYGLHRAIGAHVSRGKCIGLDLWSPAEVEYLRAHGNAAVNAVYEAALPDGALKPTADSADRDVERFIRDKYERRRFYQAAVAAAAAAAGGTAAAGGDAPAAPSSNGGFTAVFDADFDAAFGAPAATPTAAGGGWQSSAVGNLIDF